ncbi:MAG TPA: thiamine phosphate synthase [Pseudomonadota bacterium]|nr:thiamine phosphate synthase [Pseudomonadota bacterium]
MTSRFGRGLYGMLDISASAPLLTPRSLYEPLFAAGVSVLQLRMKDAGAAAMLAVLGELMAQKPSSCAVVVNDRLDVALAGGADGVHLGQDDLPLSAARALCDVQGRRDLLIGISTHNETQAAAAIAGGADYIAVGPIFATSSKRNPDPEVGVERLAQICQSSPVPVIAIGGITLPRVPYIVAAGAHGAAIIAAVNQAADVLTAARHVQEAFGQNR